MTVRCCHCGALHDEPPPVQFMTFDGHEPEALELPRPALRLVKDDATAVLDEEALT